MACADPRAADVCNVFPTGSIRDGAEIEAKVLTTATVFLVFQTHKLQDTEKLGGQCCKGVWAFAFCSYLGLQNIVESDSNLCPFSEVMTRENRDWVSVEP